MTNEESQEGEKKGEQAKKFKKQNKVSCLRCQMALSEKIYTTAVHSACQPEQTSAHPFICICNTKKAHL
jgi:hypothetical protein